MNTLIKVLVVDDEAAIRRNYRSFLEDEGYQVMEAAEGEKGLAVFAREQPSVVLTDLQMGKMNGLEFLEAIKALSPDTPIIVVSGTGTMRDVITAIRLGAWDYVLKPVQDASELAVVINRTLERARLLNENRHHREHLEELVSQRTAELLRRNRELALLNRVMAVTAAELKPKEFLEITCRELALAFDLPLASASLMDPDGTSLAIIAEYSALDRPSVLHSSIPLPGEHPLVQLLIRQKRPVMVADAASDTRLEGFRELILRRKLGGLLALPLVIEDKVAGCLIISAAQPRSFSNEEIDLAWNVAKQVSGTLMHARLSETHHLLLTAIEQTPESIIITDLKGSILYVNPAFENVTGYGRSEAIGQNPHLLKSGKHDEDFYKKLWEKISVGEVWQGRMINKKKDGTLYTEDVVIAPVREKQEAITNYIAVKRDITNELELERRFYHAQKMEAIGQLAGGVAHDFNNILAATMMRLELLHENPGLDAETLRELKELESEAKRGAGLTRRLLMFSRRSVLETRSLNLNEVVANVLNMLGRLLGEHITLVWERGDKLPFVRADAGMLEQVLMNLAVNARDAMSSGGRITIATEAVEIDEEQAAANSDRRAGKFVCLSVSDTGCGMDALTLKRIFEPFFSTKEAGKGTGLGLATVYGIVAQHQGWLEVESVAGQGSTFRVYLPASVKVTTEVKHEGPRVVPKGQETLLVVEDDASVRKVMAQSLRVLGYRVLEAAGGQEAITCWQDHGGQIDLLLTDLVMPGGLTGLEVVERLKAKNPGLKVIISTGYSAEMTERGKIKGAGIVYLPKPYQASVLGQTVRDCLDGK